MTADTLALHRGPIERDTHKTLTLDSLAAPPHVVAHVRVQAATAKSHDSAERLRAMVRAGSLSLGPLLILVDAAVLLYDLARLLQALS